MMKKEVVLLLILVLTPIAFAQSIEDPIKKITYHAEQYETGNINYAQLIVYITSLSKDMAEEMGAAGDSNNPVLTMEQLESSLGKPTESTKWVWIEGEEREKKLDKEASAWRKIIFDGKKIQIWLNAWPNIISKNGEDQLIYRLHLEIIFKKPEEQLDINSKIEEIKSLAEKYKENKNNENLDILAKASVSAEQLFNSYFNQNPGKCEEVMNDLFGSENKRENQKTFAEDIVFYEGNNFETRLRLEMCDECDWSWINLNMWFESRGNFERPDKGVGYDLGSKRKFESLSHEDFKKETTAMVDKIKSQIAEGNYQSAMDAMQELRILTESWNEKSNDVWKEFEEKYKIDWGSMTQEESEQCSKTYCWIKKEQERRIAEQELRNANYQDRKEFYLNLFSNYEKKEFYYEQEEWEKRLVEEFKEFGEEICSNNIDDNNNEQVDCSDSQCGGKVCGYDIITLEEGNATIEKRVELYCIAGSCQQKEEIVKEKIVICGNHICEENEQETCAEDCAICFEHKPVECSGNVIFSGEDEKGCPLEPICLAEQESCNTDDDCIDPLCGSASCIKGVCQVTELTECKEPECIDGQEKIQNCESGEKLVAEKCIESLWIKTDIACEIPLPETKEPIEETPKEECIVKSDCGNDNDVCSNGKCVTLPESIDKEGTIEQEIKEPKEQEPIEQLEKQEVEEIKEESPEQPSEQEPVITGEVTLSFFKTLKKITGLAVEEEKVPPPETENPITNDAPPENIVQPEETGIPTQNAVNEPIESRPNEQKPIESRPDEQNREEERRNEENREEERRNEENKEENNRRNEEENRRRREAECNERCGRECYDREVRPCTEKCIREECGNELKCNVDDVRVGCESKCESENNIPVCKDECFGKCIEGKETWIEPKREEHKEEKFVFNVGGSCRTAQGKKEGFIWFGGWGENFDDFTLIKTKYHLRGESDWCKQDLENLLKQRRELENSMNEEFAYWFFEKYVANSAQDWENHISGIFDLYWRDVDISRQIAERSQCLKNYALPEHKLINLKYDTDYGSVEFWEEVKTAKLYENGSEVQIISPYLKTWLFPSKEFFKNEMKRSMERHEIPGPPEQGNKKTLTEEEKIRLMENDEFISRIKDFNEKYGENLVVQLKDFNTGEVAFNVYIKINEKDVMHFEPMLPSENPTEDVRIELDVNKLLNIIEYEESGRVELESPPWDKRPRTGFVKSVKDNVQMFFMFMSFMNSAQVTPESAEEDAKFFVRNFLEVAMGGNKGPKGSPEQEFDKENVPEDWKETQE